MINASNKPYQGAFSHFNGLKLIIWDAELSLPRVKFLAVPGQVTCIGKDCIEVACKQGRLKIKLIEYQGKQMKPNEVIKSTRARLG